MNENDILDDRIPIGSAEVSPGVYILFEGDKVVYVGQGVQPLTRIKAHLLTKIFDSYRILPCGVEDLNRIEAEYTAKYLPKYNKSMPSTYISRSIGRLIPDQKDQRINIRGVILKSRLYLNFSDFEFDLECGINADQKGNTEE